MLQDYATSENLLYFETSALEGKGIQEMFVEIANNMPKGMKSNPTEQMSIQSEVYI